MAFNVGAIVGEIRFETGKAEADFKGLASAVRKGSQKMDVFLGNVAANAVRGIVNMIGQGTRAIVGFLANSSKAAIQFENTMTGLQGVGRKLGIEFDRLKASAQGLAEDGLVSVDETAEALKTLLAAGFGLDESKEMISIFKDAASFGRAAHLSIGEAITTAAQGIKNQNSELVDNVGITKNLSNIMADAGMQLADLNAQGEEGMRARQSLLEGLRAEGALFEGDAEAVAGTLGGLQSKIKTNFEEMSRFVGQIVNAALKPFLEFVQPVIEATRDWMSEMTPGIVDDMAQALGDFFGELDQQALIDNVLAFMTNMREKFGAFLDRLKDADVIATANGFLEQMATALGSVAENLDKVGTVAQGLETAGDVIGLIFHGINTAFLGTASVASEVSERVADDFLAGLGVSTSGWETFNAALASGAADSVQRAGDQFVDLFELTDEGMGGMITKAGEEVAALGQIRFENDQLLNTVEVNTERRQALIQQETAAINDQAEAIRLVAQGVNALPGPLQRAGNVIINVFNGTVSGRESIGPIIEEGSNRGDSNQGGGSGGGETPLPQ